MRHILSALVMNQPGVLAHISQMLASRAFNIDSLAVGATENPSFSRITFVVNGNDRVLDQVRELMMQSRADALEKQKLDRQAEKGIKPRSQAIARI